MIPPTAAATNIIIYAIPGSQFVFKVLAALQSRNIPHYVHLVPIDERKRRKVIPSGGLFVPELQVGLSKTDRIIVSDSEKILHWFDENQNTNFFPTQQACELSERASNQTLAGMVWYYNWVNPKGYINSMQKSIAESFLPVWVLFFRTTLVDAVLLKKNRSKFRTQAAQAIGMNEDEMEDEPAMRRKLIDELKFYQELLTTTTTDADSTKNNYFLPGDQPTAVDFSVYAQVERLVGTAGLASDVKIYAAIPELLENTELERLWEWFQHMQQSYKVQFKNKRVPADIAKELF
jgi:glutathione S-transferase